MRDSRSFLVSAASCRHMELQGHLGAVSRLRFSCLCVNADKLQGHLGAVSRLRFSCLCVDADKLQGHLGAVSRLRFSCLCKNADKLQGHLGAVSRLRFSCLCVNADRPPVLSCMQNMCITTLKRLFRGKGERVQFRVQSFRFGFEFKRLLFDNVAHAEIMFQ